MSEEHARVLGIDYGSKRVGVAISDPLRLIAQPVATLENNDTLFRNIYEIVKSRSVGVVIVGMPYAPDGGKGKTAEAVDRFIVQLKLIVQLPIMTWDESNSSVSAQRVFIEAGMKKKQRRKKSNIDVMAARLMLQEYLDSHSSDRQLR